jgi:hypothetical protein
VSEQTGKISFPNPDARIAGQPPTISADIKYDGNGDSTLVDTELLSLASAARRMLTPSDPEHRNWFQRIDRSKVLISTPDGRIGLKALFAKEAESKKASDRGTAEEEPAAAVPQRADAPPKVEAKKAATIGGSGRVRVYIPGLDGRRYIDARYARDAQVAKMETDAKGAPLKGLSAAEARSLARWLANYFDTNDTGKRLATRVLLRGNSTQDRVAKLLNTGAVNLEFKNDGLRGSKLNGTIVSELLKDSNRNKIGIRGGGKKGRKFVLVDAKDPAPKDVPSPVKKGAGGGKTGKAAKKPAEEPTPTENLLDDYDPAAAVVSDPSSLNFQKVDLKRMSLSKIIALLLQMLLGMSGDTKLTVVLLMNTLSQKTGLSIAKVAAHVARAIGLTDKQATEFGNEIAKLTKSTGNTDDPEGMAEANGRIKQLQVAMRQVFSSQDGWGQLLKTTMGITDGLRRDADYFANNYARQQAV